MNKDREFSSEVAVVGGGPAGLVCAIALKAAAVDTVLIAPPAKPDHRTTALLSGSVIALETLDAWQACRQHAAPLKKLRIVDDTQRLFRAPEVVFDAAEIGLDAFGYNIENRFLLAALEARAAELRLPRIAVPALAIKPDGDGVTIEYATRRSAIPARRRGRRCALAGARRSRVSPRGGEAIRRRR